MLGSNFKNFCYRIHWGVPRNSPLFEKLPILKLSDINQFSLEKKNYKNMITIPLEKRFPVPFEAMFGLDESIILESPSLDWLELIWDFLDESQD